MYTEHEINWSAIGRKNTICQNFHFHKKIKKNLRFLVLVVLLAIAITSINGVPPNVVSVSKDIKRQLLTVEQGCGYSTMRSKRIIGGSDAKEGNVNS